MTLTNKIAACMVGIVLLSGALITYFTYELEVNLSEEREAGRLQTFATDTIHEIDRFFYERYIDILQFASDPIISSQHSTPEAVSKRLIEFRNTSKIYASLSIFDLSRIRLFDTNGLNLGQQDAPHEHWEFLKNNESSVAPKIERSTSFEEPVAYIATKIRDNQGHHHSTLVARVPIHRLNEIIDRAVQNSSISKTIKFNLFMKGGTLVYSNHNTHAELETKLKKNFPEIVSVVGGDSGTFFSQNSKLGDEFLCAFSKQKGYMEFRGQSWVLVVCLHKQIITQQAVQIRNKLLLIFSIIFFLSLFLIRVLSLNISEPIKNLRNSIKSFSEGNPFKARISSKDELGQLASAFQEMAEKRLTAENEIRKRENLLQGILDNSPAIIFMKDLSGRYLKINKHCEEILNLTNEDVVGRTAHEILPKDLADQFSKNDQKLIESLEPQGVEETIPGTNGNKVFYSIQFPIRNPQGEPIGICGISTDISEQKKAENLLNDYKDQLEKDIKKGTRELRQSNTQLKNEISAHRNTLKLLLHAEKLSALGKLTSSIAHEFNNPIYAIRLILEQLREEIELNPDQQISLDVATKECSRMANMISNLKGFYLPTSADLNEICIHHVIEEVLTLLKRSLEERGITIKKHFAPDSRKLLVVEDQMRQVFLNFLQNAMDSISPESGEKTIEISSKFSNTQMQLWIKDSGSGIEVELLDSIFEPFVTNKTSQNGTGLGLSISRRIIQDHGGHINVASSLGKGTTFEIILPAKGEKYER